MWWTGTKEAIDAAEAQAAALVTCIPEYKDGVQLPEDQWVTKRWAEPAQTLDGRWAIPAYPGMAAPEGCTETETVEWPEDPS